MTADTSMLSSVGTPPDNRTVIRFSSLVPSMQQEMQRPLILRYLLIFKCVVMGCDMRHNQHAIVHRQWCAVLMAGHGLAGGRHGPPPLHLRHDVLLQPQHLHHFVLASADQLRVDLRGLHLHLTGPKFI